MTVVKLLRILLVALLALLLPLRGALAAVTVCGEMDHGVQTEQPAHDHTGHGHDDDDRGHGHGHDGITHVAKCGVSCAVTPLASSEPRVAGLVAIATIAFPAYGAPATSFISTGPERPPRTI
jgi:hypothetical protein